MDIKDYISELELKVSEAQQKEKLGIERQKVFGQSQTQVEQSRHENIMEELKMMKENGIVAFNRSSYPFYARHKKPVKKEEKQKK